MSYYYKYSVVVGNDGGDKIWLHLEPALCVVARHKPKCKSATNCHRRRRRVVCQKVALVVKVSCINYICPCIQQQQKNTKNNEINKSRMFYYICWFSSRVVQGNNRFAGEMTQRRLCKQLVCGAHRLSALGGGEKPPKLLSYEGRRRRRKKYASPAITALKYNMYTEQR